MHDSPAAPRATLRREGPSEDPRRRWRWDDRRGCAALPAVARGGLSARSSRLPSCRALPELAEGAKKVSRLTEEARLHRRQYRRMDHRTEDHAEDELRDHMQLPGPAEPACERRGHGQACDDAGQE